MALKVTSRRDGKADRVKIEILDDTVINGIGHVFAKKTDKNGKVIREADIIEDVDYHEFLILQRFGRAKLADDAKAANVEPEVKPRRGTKTPKAEEKE